MAETELYYRHHIFCCANQRPAGHPRGCCQEKNAESLRNYLKRRAKEAGLSGIRVNNAGCLDRCEHGPVIVVYPEGVWYRPQTEADMDEILSEHLQHGRPVARLLLRHAPWLKNNTQAVLAWRGAQNCRKWLSCSKTPLSSRWPPPPAAPASPCCACLARKPPPWCNG